MTNSITLNTVRFIALLLMQVVIFNKILLLGFVNPYPYVIFILLFPIKNERWIFMLLCFLIGLTLDMFGNSGGSHAAACLLIGYLRPFILESCFGLNYIHQNLKLNNAPFKQLTIYVVLMCFIHHITLFSLEVFEINYIKFIVSQTLFSGIFSIATILLSLSLFKKGN
ncbi:rod shape-determining protein MreD [Aquimarina agarivorans]|uniref:rod shape-determining protein MreD n=1 Tax=Aquimarina agarivorans TaxID=980584 RepID=UPI000248F8BF|nr:rod shape-determining protein MreD [Aquimarina agarivorans]